MFRATEKQNRENSNSHKCQVMVLGLYFIYSFGVISPDEAGGASREVKFVHLCCYSNVYRQGLNNNDL